jgi:hypothetical protein
MGPLEFVLYHLTGIMSNSLPEWLTMCPCGDKCITKLMGNCMYFHGGKTVLEFKIASTPCNQQPNCNLGRCPFFHKPYPKWLTMCPFEDNCRHDLTGNCLYFHGTLGSLANSRQCWK